LLSLYKGDGGKGKKINKVSEKRDYLDRDKVSEE